MKSGFLLLIFTLCVGCIPLLGADEDNEDSSDSPLLVYFDFEEESGVKLDSQVNNSQRSIIVGASRVEGKIGHGVKFGPSSSFIEVREDLRFPEGNFTIQFWIKPLVLMTGEIYWVFGDRSSRGFDLKIIDKRLEIYFDDLSYLYSDISLALNTWSHVAVTSDGFDVKLYINGSEKSSINISLPLEWIFNTRIGNENSSGSVVGQLNATIDEFKVWKRALTSEEVESYYNSTN